MERIGTRKVSAEDAKRVEELLAGAFGFSDDASGALCSDVDGGQSVDDLVEGLDLEAVARVLEAFFGSSGFALALVSTSGRLLAATRHHRICADFYRSEPATRLVCEGTDRAASAEVAALVRDGFTGPHRYHCAQGLREIAQPLFIQGSHWATICLGQFLYEDDALDEAALAARARGAGWDEADFLDAMRAVPRFSREEVERALGFCVAFGDLVSRLTYGVYRERSLAHRYLEVERALASAFEEKTFLFAELQHRVKNSLSLIAGLLSLESQSLGDERTRRAFEDAKGRIRSVALLYERLYKTGSTDSVDLGPYVAETVKSAVEGLATIEGAPALELDCASLNIDTRRAIYVGLVANELAVNALKHAFADGRPGRLRVSLRSEAGSVELSTDDDGPGLPQGFALESQEGFGVLVLGTLAKQLDGRIETGPGLMGARGPGASFVLRFPL
jgi:two-component sensor histidine kinase